MKVVVKITKQFATAAKPLLKKYPSLRRDLLKLEDELMINPKQGTSLGHNAYKIRLRINSKAKGKSGGARVISLIDTQLIGKITQTAGETIVSLIYIYDKVDTATITDKELRNLIKNSVSNGSAEI